jgi:hypothetical protein
MQKPSPSDVEKKYLLPVATVLSYFPVREFVWSKLPQAADRNNGTRTDI